MSSHHDRSVTEALRAIREALVVVEADDVADAPVAAISEQLSQLRAVIDLLEMQASRRLARFDACRGYESDGCRSAKAWLIHHCGMLAGEAARRLTVARQAHRLPATVQAHEEGAIGFGHVQVIAGAVEQAAGAADPREWTADQLAERAEPILLDAAGVADPGRVATLGRRLHHVLDPDGAERGHERNVRDRELKVATTLDGVVDVRGHGDAATGASVKAAIEAFTAAPRGDDDRTAGQRRWDALVHICEMALRHSGRTPDSHGEPTQVRLLVPLSTLRREDGSPAAETDWSQVLPASAARALSCDSVLRRIVTHPLDGRPLDVGSATRTIPVHIRIAVTATYRTCQWEGGCDLPVPWCDLHHVQHYADGGPTELGNLKPLCRSHHVQEHLRDAGETRRRHDHHQQHQHRRRRDAA